MSRHVEPGHEKDYADWFGRTLETIKKFPGYRGTTSLVPAGTDPDARIVLYRFADKGSMENWKSFPERKNLVSEVERYATQYYIKSKRSGDLVQADQHALCRPHSGRWRR